MYLKIYYLKKKDLSSPDPKRVLKIFPEEEKPHCTPIYEYDCTNHNQCNDNIESIQKVESPVVYNTDDCVLLVIIIIRILLLISWRKLEDLRVVLQYHD